MADSILPLVVVEAYYLDPSTGSMTELLPQNRLAAQDFVPLWQNFRAAMLAQGWEPLISPPNDPNDPRASQGYTKGFFRTPEDQALLYSENPAGATPEDQGAHQAGRAFDLDLAGMQSLYPTFDYGTIASIAASFGLRNLASAGEPEPWHFDDNPAATYGSSTAAIEAIGNLSSQVNADMANGLPRPEEVAVSNYDSENLLIAGVGLSLIALIWWVVEKKKRILAGTSESRESKTSTEVRATL
jgi:hypothetical protein